MAVELRSGAPTATLRSTALLASVALLTLGNGLQGTIVGVRGGVEGMADATIGLIMSAFFAGFVLGSVFVPRLVESVGHIRTFAALASIASAVALAFALVVEPAAWLLLRFVAGACHAGMVVVVESWLNASTERRNRGRVLAVYMVVVYAAWALSQPLLTLAPVDGFVLFCLVSIFLSLALVPITLARAGVPGVVEAKRAKLQRLYAISPLGLVGAFALGLAMGAYWGMAPVFGHAAGFDEATISALLSLTLVGALLLQWPLGWLSDRVDRRYVIVATAAATAVAALAIALGWPAGPSLVLPLALLLGAAGVPGYSLCVAHVNDHVEPGEVVAAASGLLLVFGAGSAIGPFAASIVMTALGPGGLFVFMAVTLAGFAVYALNRLAVSRAPAPEDKESFVAVPQTSHAVLPLHEHGTGTPSRHVAPQ